MSPPPIQVFLTTIASQPALRQRQEYILRILQAKRIPFSSYDLASDDEAKRLWRRKAPVDKQQLPGILVGGTCPGAFADFEEAVEFGELTTFLRLDEAWDESIEESRPQLPVKPIGVPGASSPSQMAKPEHRALLNASPASSGSPSPLRGKGDRTHLSPSPTTDADMQKVVADLRKRNEAEYDVSDELSGYGLQGVKVTDDDLMKLVEELGLEGDEAGDLVKGLSDMTGKPEEKEAVVEAPGSKEAESKVEAKVEAKAEIKEAESDVAVSEKGETEVSS
ncbi:hypothetical protein BV25DRAFT_1818704 [Artomyces pyxidatus]|uniref:Uncharacterized protein n=1 Tax=Artomyces pyxidatus TaxID=48021 RepID=A0ACB8TIM6_9AGAM|nr:hypothetical protein BV25DRAFT_1818704 [Artomyces pyxidatus]